jgi:hypothetical protein
MGDAEATSFETIAAPLHPFESDRTNSSI